MKTKLKKGDLLLTKGDSRLGFLIKWFTKSKYSHVAIHIENGTCIESHWGGVQLKHISQLDPHDVYRHSKHTKAQMNMAIEWMISQLDKGYDFFGVIGIGLALLGIRRGNPFDDKNRYWCSELIADGFHKADIPIDIPLGTLFVSPQDLATEDHISKVKV